MSRRRDFLKTLSAMPVVGSLVPAGLASAAPAGRNFFKELGVGPEDDPERRHSIDQYWIEVAYQCVKMELQRLLGRFNFEIRIVAHGGRKERWALKNHPNGRGVKAATQGREAREHYRRLRGFIPA